MLLGVRRVRWSTVRSWRELVVDGYDPNVLYNEYILIIKDIS